MSARRPDPHGFAWWAWENGHRRMHAIAPPGRRSGSTPVHYETWQCECGEIVGDPHAHRLLVGELNAPA